MAKRSIGQVGYWTTTTLLPPCAHIRESVMSDHSTSIGLYSILKRSEDGIITYCDRYQHEVGDIVQLTKNAWNWYLDPYHNFGISKERDLNEILFVVVSKQEGDQPPSDGICDRRHHYKVVALEYPRLFIDFSRYDELIPLKDKKD